LLPLAQAPADGVATQAGDASQPAESTTPLLACQQGDEEPASALVEGGEESVDVAVGASGSPVRVPQTFGAAAPVGPPKRSQMCHGDAPPADLFGALPWVFYAKWVQVIMSIA
jgi:hypothetical protein